MIFINHVIILNIETPRSHSISDGEDNYGWQQVFFLGCSFPYILHCQLKSSKKSFVSHTRGALLAAHYYYDIQIAFAPIMQLLARY